MPGHISRDELIAGLPAILASPNDNGVLKAIFARPAPEQRVELETCIVSIADGLDGDRWSDGDRVAEGNGDLHPDDQLSIMNSRCIELIARERARWALAGNNLVIDMNLMPDNLPPGQRLLIGSAIIEISRKPHKGCAKFIDRFGRDACVFVNTGDGFHSRLRGLYACVVQGGQMTVGDSVSKLA